MKTELYNKIVSKRKEELKKYFTIKDLNDILVKVLEDINIKYKNEESKLISKQNLFALKLSKVNELKVRKLFYDEIKNRINNTEIEDIDNILDCILIRYNGINSINYLYINF